LALCALLIRAEIVLTTSKSVLLLIFSPYLLIKMFLFKDVRNTGHLTISDAISDFVAGKNVMAK
jgi:hypothetical protein